MDINDFPTRFGLGSYGGLACTLLAAAGITTYALLRRQGSSRQLARSVLACLMASVFMLAPIWWDQNRLELYGPSLAGGEVLLWLCWTAILGWLIPLGMLVGYVLLAEPQLNAAASGPHMLQGSTLVPLDDPARYHEPLGPGIPWGQLIPVGNPREPEGSRGEGQPIILTRQMTVLGREKDCDIVIEDERTSRHHAEIDWDHGRVQVVDRNSMNGTLVNRQTVRGPVPLVSGDILELGSQRYRFELLSAAQSLPKHPERHHVELEVETKKVPTILPLKLTEPAPLILTGLSPCVSGATWPIDQPVITVGRDQERQVSIPDESVSRLHAQIVRQQAGYFLSDLNSSNGTFLNGEVLRAPSLVAPGDIVRIGSVELQCDEGIHEKSQQSTIPLGGTSTVAQTV
ncbi:MAG: FHA domain-containing protein [Ktedonobacterales bacterium]